MITEYNSKNLPNFNGVHIMLTNIFKWLSIITITCIVICCGGCTSSSTTTSQPSNNIEDSVKAAQIITVTDANGNATEYVGGLKNTNTPAVWVKSTLGWKTLDVTLPNGNPIVAGEVTGMEFEKSTNSLIVAITTPITMRNYVLKYSLDNGAITNLDLPATYSNHRITDIVLNGDDVYLAGTDVTFASESGGLSAQHNLKTTPQPIYRGLVLKYSNGEWFEFPVDNFDSVTSLIVSNKYGLVAAGVYNETNTAGIKYLDSNGAWQVFTPIISPKMKIITDLVYANGTLYVSGIMSSTYRGEVLKLVNNTWKPLGLPNCQTTTSLIADTKGTIYVGGTDINTLFGQIWSYNVDTASWNALNPQNSELITNLTVTSSNQIFACGQISPSNSGSVWSY